MKTFIRALILMLSVLLVGSLAVGLTACNDSPDDPDTSGTDESAETPADSSDTETPAETVTECTHVEAYKPVDDTNHDLYCTACNETLATEAHTWDEGTVTTEPTVEAEGVKTFTCTVCAHTRTEAVEKLNIKDVLGLDIKLADLNDLMQPIFSGTTVMNETVMFLDKGDVKSLLYPIDSIQSVTSYDGKKVYEEGKDYAVVDGKLQVLEGSSIPCITSQKYYNNPGSLISINYNGTQTPIHWGEGQAMTNWQVNVNYTHSATWEGYTQDSQLDIYQNFIKKLQNGENVTVFFYGDSITYGANASWINGYAPYQMSYPILFVQSLADLFDYTVHYEAANLGSTSKVPAEDYVAGTRGIITYVNTAVGGWKSEDGVSNVTKYVEEKITAYGCDLFVLGFGMNDAAINVRTTQANCKAIVDAVLAIRPETAVTLVSTMMPNPDGLGWYGNQKNQETVLVSLAAQYREDNVACGVSCVGSVSKAILKIKDFHDYSGNNINHPNDYFVRVYAQTLLQAVIGYENMN